MNRKTIAAAVTAVTAALVLASVPCTAAQADGELQPLYQQTESLRRAGRNQEALAVAERIERVAKARFGDGVPPYAMAANNLGLSLMSVNRLAEAEPYLRKALAINQRTFGPDNPRAPILLGNLARLLKRLNRLPEAETLIRRAVAIEGRASDSARPRLSEDLSILGAILLETNRLEEAEATLRRSADMMESEAETGRPGLATALHLLAQLKAGQGDWDAALAQSRRASQISVANAQRARETSGTGEKLVLTSRSPSFQLHALAAYRTGRDDIAKRDEAFIIAQRAMASFAERAMAQASARFSASSDAIGALVREQQNLVHTREILDGRLAAAVAQGDDKTANAIRAQRKQSDSRLQAINERLQHEFPNYAALALPQPQGVAETQALLAPDEALILFMSVRKAQGVPETGLAWAITRTDARWIEAPETGEGLLNRVAALRCGLDASGWDNGGRRCQNALGVPFPGDGQPLPFDLSLAHQLYDTAFGPFADLIEGKRLLIVPSSVMAGLPFQALVTERPATAIPPDWRGYAGAKWLGRDHAITILPSVASVANLRRNVRPSQAPEAFIGIGDPVLEGGPQCGPVVAHEHCPGEGAVAAISPSGSRSARSASRQGDFQNALADVRAVRRLCPLPDTAHELKCVARSLGAPPERVITGLKAAETLVKSLPFDRYRIVHFATHGLTPSDSAQLSLDAATQPEAAGERGAPAINARLSQPALVLTPPAEPTPDDDGLLTAAEITRLKLNADWVVLSACNTASAGNTGGEALSGLARAFFYAGARAVLVSQWEVDSNAATMLTTGAFKALRDAPDISQAEALRRSAVALMDDAAEPRYAHPASWAPFMVVGGK